MKYIDDFLFALRRQNIEIRLDGDNLRFSAPAGALTRELRSELSARKAEIVDALRRKAIFDQPIPRQEPGAEVPATFAQQRLLFLEQLEEQYAVYNVPAVFHCDKALDERVLGASLIALVERHESLRGCFPMRDGQAMSRVGAPYNPLRVTDLSQLTEDARREQIDALLNAHTALRFDLANGPLLDLHLIKLGGGRQILAFNTHHIVSDGWSVGVMLREWRELYNALSEGRPPALAAMPIQFNDYAAWQRQLLERGLLTSQLTYWRDQLQGLPELLDLPTDWPRPPVMTFQGRHLHTALPEDLARRVRQFSGDQGVTVFMTLLAVFNLLMHRWSAQDDLAIGTPIANRSHPQTEGLIGLFVNTLVLRSRIDGAPSFRDIVRSVRQTALSAYANQDLPFDRLVEELNPARAMSHAPIFQVMFALQNAHQEEFELGGVALTLQKPDYRIAKSDLSLSVTERDGGMECDWEYRTDLFRPETIARMAAHFEQLLRGVLANPDMPVTSIPMLTEDDARQVQAWASNPIELPGDLTVVDLFEARAAQYPGRVALTMAGQSTTYAELNAQANRIAHRLISMGARPDQLVGLCVERSPAMIAGLLGILKAGSAYLPLDPEYPRERLAYMMADAGVTILVTQPAAQTRLPVTGGVAVLALDDPALASCPCDDPGLQAGPEHLAYAIYTSGSTGTPKGVTITHGSLANYARSMARDYQVTPSDRVLQFSSINFDVSAEEIHTSLITGACLVLRDPDMLATEQDFLDACGRLGITVWAAPTAYWQQVVDAEARWPSCLRLVIIGGEAVSPGHVARWQQRKLSAARLFNSYGPTEATIAATGCWLDENTGPVCPIGKPLPNARVYLLDAHLNPVPPGVVGELCIAGPGLARGYLNQPELNAEKFPEVTPFGEAIRIYRSGDLARWLPDGNLEYRGRIDAQVKLRGFRIELGEIETALTSHDAVGQAVAVMLGTGDDRFLAAYVTAKMAGSADLPASLRNFLHDRLPRWMVPAHIVVLDSLPLTANGKVDHRALPPPDRAAPREIARLVPPRTAVEQQIAAVWRKVLKLEQVGVQDNFFDLGGHSLLLLRVLGHLRETFGTRLSAVALFQYPTIQSLAAHLAETAPAPSRPDAKGPAETNPDDTDIAIIGMAGRFPGAADIDAFWRNLREGVESIRFFTDEELLESGIDPQLFNRPDYVRAGATLDRPDHFDAAFFGYPPAEAALLDPQQRLFMETAWTALEHAGYDTARIDVPVGIYAGSGASSYFLNNLWPNQALVARFGLAQVLMGGDKDMIATRVAYKLDLRGPALSISTACSTSLVAVHMARQSLLLGECRMALAGSASVFFPQVRGYVYQEGMILSPDGHCRAFDADAQGSVGGAGVAAVVLKRLSHALEDGDTIHAVIKGSAINNDGNSRVGFTAPSVEGQSRVIQDAMRGLDYDRIGYVEAHGTGTLLGDPIEIAALNQAYGGQIGAPNTIALGSVKTNIGHLDTAAGVAGLIKTVMALKHREIPPTLHYKTPNPQIDFESGPFFVNAELRPWESATPRRAAVSSFGIGGTNAHVVLEEAPPRPSPEAEPWQLICLSARTEPALRRYRQDLADYLTEHPDIDLADAAYTLQVGRSAFAYRGFIVGRDGAGIASQLRQEKTRHFQTGRAAEQPGQVVFMFPGQGSQHVDMARGLYEREPRFRATVDECAALLEPWLGLDIRSLIYPTGEGEAEQRELALKSSHTAQPALFVVEYALARLCMDWGIQPSAVIGHSIGEYVAACLAGVFSLPDALRLVAARGRLMQSVPAGEMLSILLPAAEVEALLPGDVYAAAYNGPSLVSVSGMPDAIARFSETLTGRRVMFTRVQTLNAAHSPMMQPVLEPLRAELRRIALNPPRIPFISNLTGTWITAAQATSVEYWCEHLRQPVRFSEGLRTLAEQDAGLLLEVGPDMVLTTFARQHRPGLAITALNLLRGAASAHDDMAWTLGTLGQLWLNNVPIDWAEIHRGTGRLRVPMPTYPFERQRHWIDPVAQTPVAAKPPAPEAILAPAAASVAETRRPGIDSDYVPPVTATQRKLADIWQELLGVVPVGNHDDFFSLGGNSLQGVQVLSRLRDIFAVEIPLNSLFLYPVLEDLAAWLDGEQSVAQEAPPPILPQPEDAALAMSFPQQRLRFLAQLEGDSATYNLPGVVRLTGRLDEQALRTAFAALIRRHDSLRLSFPIVDGEARVIKGDVYDPVVVEDIAGLSAEERRAFSEAWMIRHARAPFDLSNGPLLRLHVLKLGTDEQILLINMHHIISDGWTIGLLIHEWSELYNAAVRGQQAALPALPIQYTDYAAWQHQWLRGEVLDRQMDYWRRKLSGAPELLQLPADFPRPAVVTYRGAHRRLVIPRDLAQTLRQFSQAQGVTLFMTLLAAFKALLYRYSGQQDLLVGTPVANRTRRETENLIGYFVNTLVLRTVVDGRGDFQGLLRQVRQTALEAQDHQDIPFDHLVEQLNPARGLSHAPLFQVMFALQNAPVHPLALDGLRAALVEADIDTAKFDLTLSIEERDGALACDWEYSTDLFRAETIVRMHDHFQVLLRAAAADPSQLVSRLPLLTQDELDRIAAWNDTTSDYPREQTLAELFEAQAAAAPDQVALVFGEQRLTYRELNARANQIAHALIARGVTDETLVGLFAERSPDLIAGIIGVLKAGGAYVPLDLDYPAERLRLMLEDSGAGVLLTQVHLHDRLPPFQGTVLDLDGAFSPDAEANPARRGQARGLAVVFYTSGSTGQPKGVCVPQYGVVRLVRNTNYQRFDANTRMAQVSNTSFDAASYEIWGALLNGGTLIHVPKDVLIAATGLGDYLRQHAITSLLVTTAVFNQIALTQPHAFNTLDYVIFGGETADPASVGLILEAGGPKTLMNAYGPTESTTLTTWYEIVRAAAGSLSPVPIGRPISNTRVYILGAEDQLQPAGVPGELCVAGDGLALGYLNRPDLTAEKFVDVEVLGRRERVYRTGDVARWLPAGDIDFVGRVDNQIKLRGFRVELGEIESALTRHDDVAEALVVLHEKEGNRFLAAYATGHGGAQPVSADTLRTYLRASLPEWMVPASITVLDRFPITPNGKIDRAALPEPAAMETGRDIAPRTDTERLLANLWSTVLKTEVRGMSAHFFDLGGHSLLATQLVSRIRDSFGVEMPLRALFEHPVLADLAGWLAQRQRGGALPPILPQPETAALTLSASQERLWFLGRLEGPSATYNIPAAVSLRGTLNLQALRETFRLMVERHQSLRMCFPEMDGAAGLRLLPVYDPLEVVDLGGLSGPDQTAEVQRRMREHATRPFDLATGPLLRLELLVLGAEEHVLLFNMHHIISDGWSMAILLRESGELYAELAQDRAPEPRPLPVQYTDYAAWQRRQLSGEALAQQLDWWVEHLSGAPALLELPADRPRPARLSFRGHSLQTRITPELTGRLNGLSKQQGSTLFMTLLAAFGVLLQRHGGQDDIVVGTPVANRTHSQTEDVIGFFVNTLALRMRCEAGLPFSGLLDRVRRTALDAYARQDVPFEHLVEKLRPERSLSHTPLFQVMFVLQNNEAGGIHLPGLSIEPLAMVFPTAKFDLTLSAEERQDGLVLDWEYAADLFDEATVRHLAARFEVLLTGIVDAPATDIRRLPLLTGAEVRQIYDWNDTAAPVSSELLHTLFLKQAASTPERVAVIAADRTLSYADLREEAFVLAGRLRVLGVGTNQLVAVVMDKSWQQVAAVMGILMAGGAYLPIDPELPALRRDYLLRQGDVRVALVRPGFDAGPEWPETVRRLTIDALPAETREAEVDKPDSPIEMTGQPGDLAYVIYTSGSTGLPKGVAIDHRGAVNTILDVNRRFAVTGEDRVLSLSALNFDLSVYDIFGLLAIGGCVVMPPPEARREPAIWARLLEQHGVTLWNTVPALMQMLVDHQAGRTLAAPLRLAMMSGDWIPLDLPNRIRALWPLARQISLGGATEASIWSIFYPIDEIDPAWKSIPYGKAMTNQSFFVLDAHLEHCPVLTEGELYIGGIGLALGYWRDTEKTDAAFIVHPRSGERLYRTGDLGRWLPDGNIEFRGRADTQVKIRGHRIELGEIKACLLQHELVGETEVIVTEQNGRQFLAAYVTAAAGDAPDPSVLAAVLREDLKLRLPDYMIPSSFTVLDHLPLTANGKVDRKALPAPGPIAAEQIRAPATPAEHLLCALWSQTLKIEVANTMSHFFETGGHSLLATQLVSRIRDAFGIDMLLQTVFELPVLAEQAEWLEQQQHAGAPARAAIRARAPDEPLVLSFAQQRLWFLDHLEGQSTAYNIPIALRVTGPLNQEGLRQSMRALVARHESLRLCFPDTGGSGTAVRIAAYDPVSVTDLRQLPEAEQMNQVRDWLADFGEARFDLTTGPLFHLQVLLLSETEQVLLFNMHHIISDGWSMGVIVRDWSALYRAHVSGQPPALPELSIQYTDFAAWQKDWLQGEALAAQLSYWRQQLAGAPELLDLPADFARPAVKTYQGRHLGSELPADLSAEIRRVSHEHGATVFMTLLAAFNVLLFRSSGQTDLLVGSPIANRTQRQTEDLIGFFVNTLVLRTRIGEAETFTDLLQQVRATALSAFNHQDIPFEYLVEQLNPQRSLSHSPLFQVMFILQNAPLDALDLGGARVEVLEPALNTAKFDLTLSIAEQGGRLICDWEYSNDLFEAGSIAAMAARFEELLRHLTREPRQSVAAIPLIAPAEVQALADWNRTALDYPRDKTVIDLFEVQAARHPGRIAVRFGEQAMSYAELNRHANRVAHRLIAQGVGPDRLVGIAVDRGIDMLVGLLGILKAGGAYVPMDPDFPPARLRMMLEDAAVPVLVTQRRLLDRLPDNGAAVLCLDRDADMLTHEPDENPVRRAQPRDLAYVIFTSGSTGRPKGVMIGHGALVNFLVSMQQRIGITLDDRVLALTTLSFDIAGLELFLPLIGGSEVVVVSRDVAMDGDRLTRVMAEREITIMQATPATWKMLVQGGWRQQTPLTILCGGEAMPADLGRQLLGNSRQLWNVYGPTETTIWSSMHDVTSHPDRPQLIGRPIGNTSMYILDEQFNLVPPGMPGELCIGGEGLARGYLNRPDLTAEKFIEVEVNGQRQTLYRTGDLARLLRNGLLECLGRIDHQVKIRGFRIELGEIEEALNRHPRVREAAVIADAARDSLLAYVVPGAETEPDTRAEDDTVRHWEQVWSDAYSERPSGLVDARRNIAGWNSSYTLAPIPDDEMREWLDGTVARIHALAPRRILEIGCGTGMLLFRLAPHCTHYTGVDISSEALRWIEDQSRDWEHANRVTLIEAAADQIDGVAPGSVDLVIVNSVIQYFPSADYLMTVLAQAAELVAPGGAIFVGDVRDARLLEAFHTSIQMFQAEDDLPVAELRQRIDTSLRRERELLIDPAFFAALPGELPRISRVSIALKPGSADNEMTRFRYDVTLRLGPPEPAPTLSVKRLDWREDRPDLAQMAAWLADPSLDAIEIGGIPNARLAGVRRAAARLPTFEGTVGELKAWVESDTAAAADRDAFMALLGLPADAVEADCCTLHPDEPFHCRAVLQRMRPGRAIYAPPVPNPGPIAWDSYANRPAGALPDRASLAAELRAHLRSRLPAYMLPASFTVLPKLPLTPNGKIDRNALPAPDHLREGTAMVPPRDAMELRLVRIWEELLDVRPVGVRDNFFDLGGHSLLAVRLMARIEQVLAQRLPLTMLFHRGTIEELAKVLRQQQGDTPWSCLVPIQPSGTQPPLFCVHPAGGNVLCYLELAQQLGSDQPVYAFQAQGLEDNQAPHDTVAAMAESYIAAMKSVRPRGPYRIAGWSFGGQVAVEMASLLETRGERVAFLGLLDAIAPDVIRSISPEAEDDAQFFADYFAEANAELPLDHLRRLDPEARLTFVAEQGRQLGIFPADVDVARTARLVKLYRANMIAGRTHQPSLVQAGITLFQATGRRAEDPVLPADHGWRDVSRQQVEVVQVPGEHHTMVRQPHVGVLAEQLRRCLARGEDAEIQPAGGVLTGRQPA